MIDIPEDITDIKVGSRTLIAFWLSTAMEKIDNVKGFLEDNR